MELDNWSNIIIIIVGVLVLWGVVGMLLKLARRVISCGCSLILALGILYLAIQWAGGMQGVP